MRPSSSRITPRPSKPATEDDAGGAALPRDDGWRAALRVFDLSYGKLAETPEDFPDDLDPFQVAAMSPAERSQLVRRVLKAHPRLAPLAPPHLFADAVEPELDDQAGEVIAESRWRAQTPPS